MVGTVAVAITDGSVTFDGTLFSSGATAGTTELLHVLGAGPEGAFTLASEVEGAGGMMTGGGASGVTTGGRLGGPAALVTTGGARAAGGGGAVAAAHGEAQRHGGATGRDRGHGDNEEKGARPTRRALPALPRRSRRRWR